MKKTYRVVDNCPHVWRVHVPLPIRPLHGHTNRSLNRPGEDEKPVLPHRKDKAVDGGLTLDLPVKEPPIPSHRSGLLRTGDAEKGLVVADEEGGALIRPLDDEHDERCRLTGDCS